MRFTKWVAAVVAAGSLLFVGFAPASAGDRDGHEPCPTGETVDDGEVHATSSRDGKYGDRDGKYGDPDGKKDHDRDGKRDHKKDRKKDECPPEEEPPEEEPPEEEPPEEEPEPEPAVAVVVEPVFTG